VLKRGYILLETLVAGGIVTVGLGTTITIIASSRFESSMAARRAEASAYAMATTDVLMASSTLTSQPLAPVPDHPGLQMGYTIVTTPNEAASSVPPLLDSDAMHLVSVTVEFPTSRGPQTFTYQRLRRNIP
jgi:hypothetical protein